MAPLLPHLISTNTANFANLFYVAAQNTPYLNTHQAYSPQTKVAELQEYIYSNIY